MLVVEGESLLEPAQGHLEEGRVPPQVMAEVMALQWNTKQEYDFFSPGLAAGEPLNVDIGTSKN